MSVLVMVIAALMMNGPIKLTKSAKEVGTAQCPSSIPIGTLMAQVSSLTDNEDGVIRVTANEGTRFGCATQLLAGISHPPEECSLGDKGCLSWWCRGRNNACLEGERQVVKVVFDPFVRWWK